MDEQLVLARKSGELKSEIVSYLEQYEFDYLITLNFNNLKDDLKAQDLIRVFLRSVDSRIFGKKSEKSVRMVVSLERHKFEGYHLHILSEDPRNRTDFPESKLKLDYKDLIKACWEDAGSKAAKISMSCPDQYSWFKDIYDLGGAIEYITKEYDQGRTDTIQWELSNPTGRKIV
jgi:hypothetical protein